MTKPPAALSFDLDNLWSYLKTRGDDGWRSFPTYLPRLIPEVLEFFDRRSLRLTFFVVGQDAALDINAQVLSRPVQAGHEIGNHSFHHEPWLHTYPPERIESEISDAETAITLATGERPEGFRGPGFSWSPALLKTLAVRGYLYDASTLPTFIGPLGRRYYFAKTSLAPAERAIRKNLYGGIADGLRPVRSYYWHLGSGKRLLEIPVTTMPWLKLPFHLSYLLFLGRISESLMRAYLAAAVALCRAAGIGPSFLLHPLDFLGPEDAPGLAFFPGMDITKKRKLSLAGMVMDVLAGHFELLPLGRYARIVRDGPASLNIRFCEKDTIHPDPIEVDHDQR